MFGIFEVNSNTARKIEVGVTRYETREMALTAILSKYPKATLLSFDLDGDDAADVAIGYKGDIKIFAIERQ